MIEIDDSQANIYVDIGVCSQIAVGIEPKRKIDVVIGDVAKMDCEQAINYIKSGETELQPLVTTAQNAAENAISNAALAKQWAIGDPNEPQGNSAKYWADRASSISLDLANKDLSNLSATGEAKFAAKQDVISDLATIRSGAVLGATAVQSVTTGTTNGTIKVDGNAVSVYGLGSAAYTASTAYDAAGAASTAETSAKNYADSLASNYATAAQGAKADTAVQPSDLATVATSGSYNDLLNKPTIPAAQVNSDWNAVSGAAEILNKPTIPIVNDATITITQGGVTKGSFTLNQASGDTIALDAGGGSYAAAYVIETYSNGADWYRVWSDGWCEQGGFAAGNSSNYDTTVTLLKAYANTNYNIACCLVGKNVTSSHSYDYGYVANVSTSDFHLRTFKTSEGSGGYWQASGYIS